jgi:hypothetical protein
LVVDQESIHAFCRAGKYQAPMIAAVSSEYRQARQSIARTNRDDTKTNACITQCIGYLVHCAITANDHHICKSVRG